MSEIEKNQIGVRSGMWTDSAGNYFSICKMVESEMPRLVEESWHLRESFHGDGLFRVPVPVTHEAKPVFFTGIAQYKLDSRLVVSLDGSRLDRGELEILVHRRIESMPVAKFAELIVADADWFSREGYANHSNKRYLVVNFRALPEKEVPQLPVEIVKKMTGSNASYYRYTTDDLISAVRYWNHHCFLSCG